MKSTLFPGWRILSLTLAVWNTCILIAAASLYLDPSVTQVNAAGWVTSIDPHSASHFRTLVFSIGLTLTGALVSVARPAWGFLIFGAGYLAAAISLLVFFSWNTSLLAGVAFLLAPGLWYSRLGFRQLGVDRGRRT
jgi:hypothetical protein